MARPRIDTLLQMRTLRAAMTDMAMQTVGQIRDNFYTQGIFPFGEAWHGQTRPWTNANGWFEENKRREGKPNAWYSTGEGVESFHWQVTGDLDNDNLPPRSLTFDFFYAEHLKFAEMGVGKGRPYSSTKHTGNAKYTNRYTEWRPWEGLVQRPSIMMEFRHLSGRLQMYLAKRYEKYYQVYTLQGLEGITGERQISGLHGKMRWYVKSDILPDLPFGPK